MVKNKFKEKFKQNGSIAITSWLSRDTFSKFEITSWNYFQSRLWFYIDSQTDGIKNQLQVLTMPYVSLYGLKRRIKWREGTEIDLQNFSYE